MKHLSSNRPFCLVFTLLSRLSISLPVKSQENSEDKIYEIVEQSPEFPEGGSALWSFLSHNLKYPAEAQKENIQGKVYTSFVVNIDGSLTDIKIIKGLGYGCDEEVLRVLNSMPKWIAGKQSGRKVRCRHHLPIQFILETESVLEPNKKRGKNKKKGKF